MIYLNIVFGVSPVPLGVQVAEFHELLVAERYPRHGLSDLSRHKRLTCQQTSVGIKLMSRFTKAL